MMFSNFPQRRYKFIIHMYLDDSSLSSTQALYKLMHVSLILSIINKTEQKSTSKHSIRELAPILDS